MKPVHKNSRRIHVGTVAIGGGAPVAIQSMTKTVTADVAATVRQIIALERLGCEIIRVAVKTVTDANAIRAIKRRIHIPLVADIHFDYRLALAAIDAGADKIRLNPGNMPRPSDIAAVILRARQARIPIRIGVNSGSVGTAHGTARDLVRVACGYIKAFEAHRFRDIIISLKASSVPTTIAAYRLMAPISPYPLHLGVTAAGPYDTGVIKSAIGIGALLADGIGDTIRVSLTGDPADEVIAARRILSALEIRRFGPEVISCPTCGRCQVDLGNIVRRVEEAIAVQIPSARRRPLRVAIMGCEVNGPGEARDADVGIAFGKGRGILFKKGVRAATVPVAAAVPQLVKEVIKLCAGRKV